MQQMADKATRHSQSDRPTDLIYAHDPLSRNPFTHAICLGFPFPMNYDLGQWGVMVKTLAFPLPKSHDRRQLGESDGKPKPPLQEPEICVASITPAELSIMSSAYNWTLLLKSEIGLS